MIINNNNNGIDNGDNGRENGDDERVPECIRGNGHRQTGKNKTNNGSLLGGKSPRTKQTMGMVINNNTDNIALAINNPASAFIVMLWVI